MQWTALGVVAVGLVGLPLLLIGWFKSYLVLPGAFIGWLFLVRLRRHSLASTQIRLPVRAHLVSLAAVVFAIGDVVVNAGRSTQHLLVDGDPAVYGMTGKWIAEHGSLNIPIHQSWLGNDQTVNYMTNGFFLRPDGHHLYPQFFHLLPALLAIGDWVGGTRALLNLNVALGGVALLAVFAFASRFLRPAWALAAMVTLAFTLPQIFFSRDTFSEIPSQLLVFAGLAMLWDSTQWRAKRPGPAGLLAGLTLGASTMVRIDAFLYMVPFVLTAAVLTLVFPREHTMRRQRVRWLAGLIGGLVLSAAIGVVDGVIGSPAYANSVKNQLVGIAAMTALIAVASAVPLAMPKIDAATRRIASRWLPKLAPAAGIVTSLAFGFAWLVRPHVQQVHETGVLDISATIANLQRTEHATVDSTRHYNEMSLRWVSWYIGPITLTLAIIGLGYLTYRVLKGRDLQLLPFVLLTGVVSAVYVYDPLIVPVQYWASRRFVPVTFPAFILLAFFLLSRIAGHGPRAVAALPVRMIARPVAALLALAVVATPIELLRGPIRIVHAYVPVRAVVADLCKALNPTDVVLLVGGSAQTNGFVQTIETYCGNMAAVSGIHTELPNIEQMARAAAASGHRLVLVSSQQTPTDITNVPLGLTLDTLVIDATFKTESLSLTHRPDTVFPVRLPVYLGTAPTS